VLVALTSAEVFRKQVCTRGAQLRPFGHQWDVFFEQVLHHRENNCCERCLRVMMVQKEMAEPAANDKYSSRVTFK